MRFSLPTFPGFGTGLLLLLSGLGILATPAPVRAGIIVTAAEVGGDVVLTGSGTANLADLTFLGLASTPAQVVPSNRVLLAGTTTVPQPVVDLYLSPSGPADFGPGSSMLATSGTGDRFGITPTGFGLSLVVPTGYVSGSALSGTSTFANESFASLGMTPGTYVWTWGTGANADSITLTIGAAAVPEPTSLTLLGLSAVGICGYARRRRKSRR